MFRFILSWYYQNKKYTGIYMLLISIISVLAVLAAHYFYSEIYVLDSEVSEYSYTFISDSSLDISDFEKFRHQIEAMEPIDIVVACKSNTFRYDDYYVMASVSDNKLNYDEMYYGSDDKCDFEYVVSSEHFPLVLKGKEFTKCGRGVLWVGYKTAGYSINYKNYTDYVGIIDAIVVIFPNEISTDQLNELKELLNGYGEFICEEPYVGFTENGFEANRNTLNILVIMFAISCFAILIFHEICMHIQCREIYIMRLCGATLKQVIILYSVANIIVFAVAYAIGLAVSTMIVKPVMHVVLVEFTLVFLIFAIQNICYTYFTVKQLEKDSEV